VPSEAAVWYFFRETEYPRIKERYELGDIMAQSAAAMTGTTVTRRVVGRPRPVGYGRRP
jgi:aminobenzoyl-glutamate utilization protein B